MKGLISGIISLFIFSAGYCQTIVAQYPVPKRFGLSKVSQIANNSNGHLALFLFGYKNSEALLFNNQMDSISSLGIENPTFDYSQNLGGIGNDNNEFLFIFNNTSKKKFALSTYNFLNNSSSFGTSIIQLKKETFLQSFIIKDEFYLLTINNKSSILNLYRIKTNGDYEKNPIDLEAVQFRHWDNDIVPLSKIIESPFGAKIDNPMSKIDTTHPNSLEITASASKMFLENEHLYLSFESNRNITQTITINLKTYKYTHTIFNKPFLANQQNGKKSNSFIFDNKYFGISGSNTLIKVEIKDFVTREIIKSYEIKKDTKLPFSNASIYFEGTGLKNKLKEVESANKLIKEISKNEVGISVVKSGNNNVITLGSFYAGTTGFGIGFGGLTAGITALYTYSTTQSTFMKGLFDESYNYLPIEVKPTSYDVLKDFINENKKNKHEIVFKKDTSYIYGSYSKQMETYSFRKFKDIN